MAEEPAEPRSERDGHLRELEREDLDIYSVFDLQERIERLNAEAERTKRALDKKQSGKSAADALFKF
jgi:uncharacterized small protein (DUF1192 family)